LLLAQELGGNNNRNVGELKRKKIGKEGSEMKRINYEREAFNLVLGFERDFIKISLLEPLFLLLLLTVVCSISQGLGSSNGNVAGVAYYRLAHASPPSFCHF